MTYDAYYEMTLNANERRADDLKKWFWVIRDAKGKDVTPPKTYSTEEEAWDAITRTPFTVADYKQKGYYAVMIDLQLIESMKQKGYV